MQDENISVLGLCSYPVEAAATRYRLIQFVEPLAEKGINLTVSPFLDSRKFADFYAPGRLFQKSFGMCQPFFHITCAVCAHYISCRDRLHRLSTRLSIS